MHGALVASLIRDEIKYTSSPNYYVDEIKYTSSPNYYVDEIKYRSK